MNGEETLLNPVDTVPFSLLDSSQWRVYLEGYFQAAGAAQPEIEAAILFAVIDGISQHYALDPARYPLDAVEDALVRRYADRG